MATKSGGYAIIKHDDSDIFSKVKKAFENEKPILFYDDDKNCYYIDAVSINGDGDYVLIKGGKTITITDANTISSTGSADAPTMENIKDLEGHVRFFELEGNVNVVSGVNITYNKCSLSGTHLMFVLAGNIDSGVTLGDDNINIVYDLPNWIKEKIVSITTGSGRVSFKNDIMVNSDWTDTQNINTGIYKDVNNNIVLFNLATTTTTETMYFRFQFDLLIDAE